MADRLGIETHIHALRHYSATEFITSGVDVSTVTGAPRAWRWRYDDTARVHGMAG